MNVRHISASEFNTLDPTRTTIDLRTAAEVESEYISNTIALPVQSLDRNSFQKALAAANHQEGVIYLLCQSGKRAEIAINKLEGHSTHELVIIDGGLNAIKAAGGRVFYGSRKTMSLERQVRIAAGGLTVLGVVLGFTIATGFFALSAFVGVGLVFAGITDTCGMGMLLAKMPWNSH